MASDRDTFIETTMLSDGCSNHDGGETGPIKPGTLYAQEFYSPAKLKAILTAMFERDHDPVKLVDWKLAEIAFLRPDTFE